MECNEYHAVPFQKKTWTIYRGCAPQKEVLRWLKVLSRKLGMFIYILIRVGNFLLKIKVLPTELYKSGLGCRSGDLKPDDDLVHRFVSGLNPDIHRFVYLEEPANVNSALELALRHEQTQRFMASANHGQFKRHHVKNRTPNHHFKPPNGSTKAPYCAFHKKPGHSTEDCRAKKAAELKSGLSIGNVNSKFELYKMLKPRYV